MPFLPPSRNISAIKEIIDMLTKAGELPVSKIYSNLEKKHKGSPLKTKKTLHNLLLKYTNERDVLRHAPGKRGWYCLSQSYLDSKNKPLPEEVVATTQPKES